MVNKQITNINLKKIRDKGGDRENANKTSCVNTCKI